VHFGQAHGTFPTVPPFNSAVDWTASTPEADDILLGTLPFAEEAVDETSTHFLHQFKVSTALNSVSSAITMQEWVGKMKVWHKSTTTSPSGMHLGHHKALLKVLPAPSEAPQPGIRTLESKRQLLLKGQLDLLNYAIRHSYTYSRWKKVATLMIRKASDSSKVHRLRVMHVRGRPESPLRCQTAVSYPSWHRSFVAKLWSIWWPPRSRCHDSNLPRRVAMGN
jgi:hypothetical protein